MNSRFEELCQIDPRLKKLAEDAVSECCKTEQDVDKAFDQIGGFKERLRKLVGWEAENPALSSSSDYEIAHKAIRSKLATWLPKPDEDGRYPEDYEPPRDQ